MRGADFRVRALHEGQRYGEDRLVFLRELAQNSRDAGARQISVTTSGDDRQFTIDFTDDGSGMSFDHARRYLFTLYASSKERETMSAGRFGVGFWSVLLVRPEALSIESKTAREEPWKLILDGELDHPKLAPSSRGETGTRIVVTIPTRGREETRRLKSEVEAALTRYCRYLRCNDRRAIPLPVELDGKPIGAPYEIDGPLGLPFSRGPVEGVVGLGERPRVELYARGLPVWKGAVLDELRYGASRAKRIEHPEGLAPVYILGGNELNVTLDRRAVIDDQSLSRVRRTARLAMRELLSRYLGGVASRPLGARIADRLSCWVEEIRLGGHLPALLGLSLILTLVVGALLAIPRLDRWLEGDRRAGAPGPGVHTSSPGGAPPPLHRTSLGNPRPFAGPAIDPYSTEQMALAYRPAVPTMFRVAAHEQLDAGRGMVADKTRAVAPLPDYRCPGSCTDVRVELRAESGPVVLPTPTGQLVEPASVRLDGAPVPSLGASAAGEPLVTFSRPASGILGYRTGPAETPLPAPRRQRLVSVPEPMELPEELSRLVSRTAGTAPEKVAQLEGLVAGRLDYDRSPLARRAYARFFATKPRFGWLDFVLAYGSGDCDVKNTVLVVLLREAGVPARLAVGVVGREGRVLPGAHAWVEYHDGGWHRADASGTERRAGPGARPSPLTAPAIFPRKTETATAPTQTSEATFTWPDRELMTLAAVVAGALALALAAVAFALLVLGSRGAALIGPKSAEERRRIAARMLSGALAHPKAWRLLGEVTEQRLLPIVGGGRPLSLAEALEGAREGALYFTRGGSSLADRAVAAGARILDATDEAFGSLITSLPGIVDLDDISALRPTPPRELDAEHADVARLATRVNGIIEGAGLPPDLVMPCPGLDGDRSRDVDLSPLVPRRKLGPWGRFVAIGTRAESFRRLARKSRAHPELGAYEALELLLDESDLLRPYGEQLRRAAGRAVFEEAP